MKKLLGIMVLGLLLIIFSDTAQAVWLCPNPDEKIVFPKNGGYICVKRGLFDKVGDALDDLDLNPVTYFEKRKECKEDAEVKARILNLPKLEKEYYKECMED